jgi:hypothetical protein
MGTMTSESAVRVAPSEFGALLRAMPRGPLGVARIVDVLQYTSRRGSHEAASQNRRRIADAMNGAASQSSPNRVRQGIVHEIYPTEPSISMTAS